MQVLIVDDSEDNRRILARRLVRRGFTVVEAEGAQQALEILDDQDVALILLDYMMPGMNGVEMLEVVRQRHSASELPIIMVTAKAEPETIADCLNKGANDYVTKPISFPVVLARMEAQIKRIEAEHDLREANTVLEQRVEERTTELRQINGRLREEIVRREDVEQGLRRAKKEAEEARVLAEAASESKSAFLANMSHELRTPLTAILGFSELILTGIKGPIQPPDYATYITDIEQSGKHLLALIDDILDMSKVEAGKFELECEPTDIEEIADHCMRLVHYRAQKSGIALKMALQPDLPEIEVDQRCLKQILLNLLSNAVKFTPHGGEVKLIAGQLDDGQMLLCVRDTGIGISEDHIKRVLEPFEQVENSFRRTKGGTGLGLPLAKSLAELHGGTLDLRSKIEAGTEVRVYFPASVVLATAEKAAS
ncbi:MAG: response regulator [Pseudomonadota bacterium]